MIQIFEGMDMYAYLIGTVTFLVYIVKAAIDFWFVTELEKKLMSDYQKLKGFFSKLIITIIPSVFLTFLFIIAFEKDFLNQSENINESFLLITFFIVIFLLNISLNLVVTIIEKVLNIKFEFLLIINEEEWNIERLTKNNLLLLKNKEEEFLLIDEWKDKKIRKVLNKKNYTYKIYSKNLNWIKLLSISMSMLGLSTLGSFYYSESIYNFFWLILGCLAVLSALIVLGNLAEYKRSNFD